MKRTELKTNENYLIFIHDSKARKSFSISFNENEFDFVLSNLRFMGEDNKSLCIEFIKAKTVITLNDFLNFSLEKQIHLLFESKFFNIDLL